MASGYYIGLECVGVRHSTAVISDQNGSILGALRLCGGISLHTTPRHQLRQHILELVLGVVERAELSVSVLQESTLCIGLSGVTFPYDALTDLRNEMEQLKLECSRIICTGDAEIIFAAFAKADTGTAIVCHMGSTAYVTVGRRRQRFGGWGPVIGDEGSGYAMGRHALRAIGEEYDRGEPPSMLWRELKAWLDSPGDGLYVPLPEWRDASFRWRELAEVQPKERDLRAAIFAFSHTTAREGGVWSWRSIASSLTIPLLRAYSNSDPTAIKIVRRAVGHLVDQHENACQIQNVAPSCGPLVLYGGVVSHHLDFAQLLRQKLEERWPGAILPEPITANNPDALRPACGALLFALGDSTTEDLRLPNPEIVKYLVQQHTDSDAWEELKND